MNLIEALARQPIAKELAFPEAEYRARLERVRQRMREQELDVLLVSSTANICYLTGYETAMPSGHAMAIVPLTGDLTLQVSNWDAPTAFATAAVRDIDVLDWHRLDKEAALAGALRDRGLHDKRIGLEAGKASTYAIGAIDARTYQRLSQLLPEAVLVDATRLVLDVRLVKSAAEIEAIRTAGQISIEGIRSAFAIAEPGRTDNELVASAYHVMISAGSELMAIDPQIMTGARSGLGPHAMYRRVPLRHGDAVYLECSANCRRYSAPIMRTASLGRPADDVRRLADAAIETLEILLDTIREGRTAHEVAVAARKGLGPVEDIAYFHGSFSYSVGLGFPPYQSDAPMYITEGNEQELIAGMTLHLPLYIFAPGRCGVGFSETVAVRRDGCEVLTSGMPRELVVR